MTLQLQRGMVLVRTARGSREAGIVLGPAREVEGRSVGMANHLTDDVVAVAHGWTDNTPTCGIFHLWPEVRGWRRATNSEASTVRALFLAHAKAWGPDSLGWVAAEVPADEIAAEKRGRALATFQRAMLRHEKRLRAMGARYPARLVREARLGCANPHNFASEARDRRECMTQWDARVAFLYERCAEAVAKFKAALTEADR